ncbi:aminotransferase-like domain-containing protein [Methanobacterium paludis]|uniref:Transcriptional regulator, GntR family n=1 Tax=Methanobacterium paludis (strain DSM 25820 / JCM 18151 / SWAN1) TaxID=868131 RepID=F6D8B7_METPW|nr:PLP-dependent aminotransferase family protein [Methanobacterium paludis]AEG18551.1 putative transcriptional regulator, GntR family [Methanobacterium paludis]
MKDLFASRMSKVPRSFVREILKVTEDPEIISFAGGLPNPNSFPHKEIAEAASKVLKENGKEALQYSTTEGYKPLREWIAERYRSKGLKVHPDNILITNGSQQGLDLVGKIFVDRDDKILVERPTYLAAIQSFGLYEPNFISVPLVEDGADPSALEDILSSGRIKLFYSIPNFQNPTGTTYSKKRRQEIASILQKYGTILVEDNPYGEIRFMGSDIPPIKCYLENSVLLGSFSKIVSPGIRLGWIVADDEVMEKLVIAKQASDLHSNYLAQRIVYRYLMDYDVEEHLKNIKKMYKKQRDLMVAMIKKYFPQNVKFTQPEGGMFLWVTLPQDVSSMELFNIAIKQKVAFVPGEAFYTDDPEKNTLRLNFSNSSNEKIEEGIKRLGNAIKKLINDNKK